MLDRLVGFFFGRDVFVSYSYDDSRYAEALAVALQKRKFSVFLGAWGASSDQKLSRNVIRAAELCRLLVVVATPSAVGSPFVQQEIDIVSKRRRTTVPIDVGGAIGDRRRWPGTDPVPEERGASPSDHVIARIENAAKFVRQEVRLRRLITSVAIASALLIGGSTWYTNNARREADAAAAATRREMTVGSALRLANDATLLMTTTPSRFTHAAVLAALSVKRLDDLGERSLVTDMALRTALDDLPKLRRKVALHGLGVFAVSQDGRFVVSEDDARTLNVFDLDAGTRTALRPYPNEELVVCAISRDGSIVATLSQTPANDLRVRTRTTRDGAEIHLFPEISYPHGWNSMALTPDGKHVAIVSNEGDHYDISVLTSDGTGEPRTLKCHAGVPVVSFSPSGTLLLIHGWPAMLWDWAHETFAHVSPRSERTKLIVDPADERVVATASHRLAIWNWREWRPHGKPRWQTDEQLDENAETPQVAFSADGSGIAWISWSRPRFLIWSGNVGDDRSNYPTQALDASGDSERREATSIGASTKQSSDFAVGYGDGVVLFRNRQPVARLPVRADVLVFGDDGSLTSADAYDFACRWSEGTRGRTRSPRQRFQGLVAVSPSGSVKATYRYLGTEISVNAPDRNVTLSEPGKVMSVAFVDDRTLVASTAEKKLHVWTWRQSSKSSIDAGTYIGKLAFDPHHRLLLAATAGEAQLWRIDPPAGKQRGIPGTARSVAFSHSGEFAITTDGRIAHVWSHWYDAPVEVARLSVGSQNSGNAIAASFSNDDRFILIEGGDAIERVPWPGDDLLAEACPLIDPLIEQLGDRSLYAEACSKKSPAAP